MNATSFTENSYEQAIIALFKDMGYTYESRVIKLDLDTEIVRQLDTEFEALLQAGATEEQVIRTQKEVSRLEQVLSADEQFVALTKELTEVLRKNRTIDWKHKESARAQMRVMIKRLLKKYKYPPEGAEEALQIVMAQCDNWAENEDNFVETPVKSYHLDTSSSYCGMVAEEEVLYRRKREN